ncbi:MAG: hypothetical protein JWN65_3611 [Solirubrobacterales bacterium]|nr:hypothetical protein [Solirubrobacterales bacterium]
MAKPLQRIPRPRPTLAVAGLGIVLALIAAGLSISTVSLSPPGVHARGLQASVAATHVLVDSPPGTAISSPALPATVDAQTRRAELLGRIMVSPLVVGAVARAMGVPAAGIAAEARTTAAVPRSMKEPDSERRANEILQSTRGYRLEVQARPRAPVIDVFAQAPTTRQAVRLANVAVIELRDALDAVAARQQIATPDRVRLRQMGFTQGGVVNHDARIQVALLTFLTTFGLVAGTLLLAGRARRAVRTPWIASWSSPRAPQATAGGDWPRTTRVLPWMLAAFMAMLWLVPFNAIQLTASLPIDLKLDRLVLPLIAATWLVALLLGGPAAPERRWTAIHMAVAAFVLCAFLSVVVNTHALIQTLELDRSLKRLPLLVAYASVFFVAASVVRPAEVPRFLRFTLGLAVLCAIGMVWEYRLEYNVFYDLPARFLPGVFDVAREDTSGVDTIGRRVVSGPGEVPLEAVAMLSMALPVALVEALRAGRRSRRVLYLLAACLLTAAVLATYRKSALLAPGAVVLTILYFRRAELLRLAPAGLAALLVAHVLSPGALGSTAGQLGGRLDAPTVSERTADYDAVRPDVLSHLIFGRGWGTYDHVTHRVLDTEILQQLVETGVIGLLAFLLIGVTTVTVARAAIARRHPDHAPAALACAAAAVAFLVVAFLFDVMSFPHVVYVFLLYAAFAAVTGSPAAGPQDAAEPAEDDADARSPGVVPPGWGEGVARPLARR